MLPSECNDCMNGKITTGHVIGSTCHCDVSDFVICDVIDFATAPLDNIDFVFHCDVIVILCLLPRGAANIK